MNSLFMLMAEQETTLDTAEKIAEDTKEKVDYLIKCWDLIRPALLSFAGKVIFAIILFFVGKFVIKLITKICNRFFEKTYIEVGVYKFLISVIRALLYVMLIGIICGNFGIETTSFVAILGSAGLAAGLALQGSLSNFAGGVLLLIVKPFKVGDYIVDGKSGKEGTVTKIDIFYTNIVTVDNKKIVIPNGDLANSTLVNVTAYDKRRVDFEVGISYNSDISLAKRVIERVASDYELVLKDEEIFVFVSNLDASQVTMGLRVWAKTEDYWTTKFDLTERIKVALDENNIEIPFNQLQVHVN